MSEGLPVRDVALLVVDVQNDFCEGGSLPVRGGTEVAVRIARYLERFADRYRAIATTRDWHVEPGRHFASAMGKDAQPDFRESWPDHCVAGSQGADYHPAMRARVGLYADAEFRKGRYEAAYSGFEGVLGDDDEARLAEWLVARGVSSVDVAGLATDYCVRTTALDARAAGFETAVLEDLVAGVSEDTTRAALDEMKRSGVVLCRSDARWSADGAEEVGGAEGAEGAEGTEGARGVRGVKPGS